MSLALAGGIADVAAAAPSKPKNTSLPTISGMAFVGQGLTAAPGAWTGTLPITFGYEWERCNADGGRCKLIGSADQPHYVLVSGDLGQRLRFRVTARNSAGSASVTSALTAVVAAALVAPSNTALPVVSGEAREGATLSASTGSWSGTEPISFGYQWQRCSPACGDLAGAIDASYVAVADDAGSRLRVRVTAANIAGSASAASEETPSWRPSPSMSRRR